MIKNSLESQVCFLVNTYELGLKYVNPNEKDLYPGYKCYMYSTDEYMSTGECYLCEHVITEQDIEQIALWIRTGSDMRYSEGLPLTFLYIEKTENDKK